MYIEEEVWSFYDGIDYVYILVVGAWLVQAFSEVHAV